MIIGYFCYLPYSVWYDFVQFFNLIVYVKMIIEIVCIWWYD